MALVFLVMFLFLQNWRATLIPTIVVPIALAGACLGLWVFGFSINVLTLFGMVLAIGILVDDAIVVVENVERIMTEEGLSPYEATVKAMTQITSAIIGITLVLVAVFVPMAFFPGIDRRHLSAVLADARRIDRVLGAARAHADARALCDVAQIAARRCSAHQARTGFGRVALRFFGGFNAGSTARRTAIKAGSARSSRGRCAFSRFSRSLVAITLLLFTRLPGSFLPAEDQGSVITVVQAPPGATIDRTNEAIEQVSAFYRAQPQVESVVVVRGFSFFGQGQANAMAFVIAQTLGGAPAKNNALTLVGKANAALSQIKQALVFTLNPPSIPVARRRERIHVQAAGSCRSRCGALARPRAINCSAQPARARCSPLCGLKARPIRRSCAYSSTASRHARSDFRSPM